MAAASPVKAPEKTTRRGWNRFLDRLILPTLGLNIMPLRLAQRKRIRANIGLNDLNPIEI
jgi:hypothetical protein